MSIIPAALLAFGITMGATCCLLLSLLMFRSWVRPEHHQLNVLRVVDEVDRQNTIWERLPVILPGELPQKELEATLGAVRVRRRTRTFDQS